MLKGHVLISGRNENVSMTSTASTVDHPHPELFLLVDVDQTELFYWSTSTIPILTVFYWSTSTILTFFYRSTSTTELFYWSTSTRLSFSYWLTSTTTSTLDVDRRHCRRPFGLTFLSRPSSPTI